MDGTRNFIDGGYGEKTGQAIVTGQYGDAALYTVAGVAYGIANVVTFGEVGAATTTVRALSTPLIKDGVESAAPIVAKEVEQYALRAKADGWYPVMKRGAKDAVETVWLQAGEVWKFGTTKNPGTRYSQSALDNIGPQGVQYVKEFGGTLKDAITVQNMKIRNFLQQTGVLPPGNKIVN